MIADCLLKRFDLIADAPGNISRLRKLIVDLAVRGKLLKKPSGDTSPEELLKRIANKRELLIKDGKLRKQKPLPPIAAEELPSAYSAHCVFDRLANVAILEKGLTGIQSSKRGEHPLVVTAETRSTCDHFDFDGAAAIIPMVSSSGHGDASLKRLHYQEGKFALGNILCAAFPISSDLISARFLFEYLTAFKEELLVSKMIGTANVSLTMAKIGDVPIPIVTPAAQQRVEELMGLCDALEAAQRERETVRTRLRTSALHRLTAPDADSKSAAFVLTNLSQITTAFEDFADMRQSVLHLAVGGQLIRQNPKDAMVDLPTLTERTANDFDERVFSESVELHTVPKGWSIHPLARVAETIVDCPHSTPKWTESGKMCVRTNQFNPGCLDLSEVRFVSDETYLERTQRLKPAENDILYSREGGILGVACRVPANTQLCLGQRMMLIRPSPTTDAVFLELVLNSPLVTGIALNQTIGGAAPRVNVSTIRAYPIPLPPLAEQRRIVAKVDELMAVLDALEAALTTARTTAASLLAATIAELSHTSNGRP